MKTLKKTLGRLTGLAMAIAMLSCESMVKVDSPAQAIDSGSLFATRAGFESAIRGIYRELSTGNLSLTNGGLSVYMSMYADDLVPRSNSANYQAFYRNSILSDNSVVYSFWNQAYIAIYRANLILEHLDSADFLSQEIADDFRGQALFIRAMHHFYLWQLYGDIPLILDTNYDSNSRKGRTNSTDVVRQIKTDLGDAAKKIGKNGRTDKAFPDFYTVQALLARVNLYTEDYRQAADACDPILDNKDFRLEELHKVFKMGSREALWQFTNEYRNVAVARSFIPSSPTSAPLFYLSQDLLNIFDADDGRKSAWINSNMVSGVPYNYPYKYQNRNNTTPVTEFYIVFRLAEIYLIRAEANWKLEKMDEAINDLNMVRQRAGLGPIGSVDPDEFKDLMIDERRREFFCEIGHRWFDLKRWGFLDDVLAPIKENYDAHLSLLPIPYSQMRRNPFLTPNPGYNE